MAPRIDSNSKAIQLPNHPDMEMNDAVYAKVATLCQQGEERFEEGAYAEAIEQYRQAYELLPSPKTDWEAGSWIWAAIGDCHYCLEAYAEAVGCFRHAEVYPDERRSGFIQLRAGQCYWKLGEVPNAKEYLLRAYLLGGREIFEGEEEGCFELIEELIGTV